MELIKNIATVIGCITASIGLLTAICKPIRNWGIDIIQKVSGKSKVENQLSEIKNMLETQAAEQKAFRESVEDSINLTIEFTENQCRRDIKEIFYKYRNTKVLPMYEKKTLLDIEEYYIKKLHKNHWGKTLLEEMATWDVDATNCKILDFTDE